MARQVGGGVGPGARAGACLTIWVRTAMKSKRPFLVRSCLRPRALTIWMAPSMWDPHANIPICLAVMF